jgi:hypothetical protein
MIELTSMQANAIAQEIEKLTLSSDRGLTLSGTKTHVKRLWLRKTKGSGEDPLVC